MSITFIENLSNECFYEIFDYLDGYKIYQAFSNLNHRFQQLLNSSSLLLKIKLDCSYYKTPTNILKRLIFIDKHQIFSLYLRMQSQYSQFFSLFFISSSFDHLESLVLKDPDANLLQSIVPKLSSLPRLFSLIIDIDNVNTHQTEFYGTILALPKLKYCKVSGY